MINTLQLYHTYITTIYDTYIHMPAHPATPYNPIQRHQPIQPIHDPITTI